MDKNTVILILAVIVIFLLMIIRAAIKIVPEYKRLVRFRLGRNRGDQDKLGPGLVLIWPIIDRVIWVDLRELFLEIPEQTCITKDNASISIDFLIYWKVIDPVASVVQVGNFAGAAQGIATTTLRAVVGDISLDDVLAKREQINEVLRNKLDEVTGRWGVKVTTVEIREITPPSEILNAMTRQMSAERTRRAVVTEADGTKQAAITVAEGNKQSNILRAEGERQAMILQSEGARQSLVLRAEGFALSLQKIFDTAKGIDEKTMTLQYLEALKSIGASPSTKFIFPLELTNLLKPIVRYAEESVEKKK